MDKENLKAIFDDLGVASNGYVNKNELAKICEYFGMENMSKKELDKLFLDLDIDKDGKISEDEFLTGMFNKPSPPTPSTPKTPPTPTPGTTEPTPDTTPTNKDDTKSPPPVSPPSTTEPKSKVSPSEIPEKNSTGDPKFDSLPNFGDKSKFPTLSTAPRSDPTNWLNYLDPGKTGSVKGKDVIDFWNKAKIPDGENLLKKMNFDPNGNIPPDKLARALEDQLRNPTDPSLRDAALETLLRSTDKLWRDNEDLVEECDKLNEEVEELRANLKDADELLDAIEQKKDMELKLLEDANQKLRDELAAAKKQPTITPLPTTTTAPTTTAPTTTAPTTAPTTTASTTTTAPTTTAPTTTPTTTMSTEPDDIKLLRQQLEDRLKESADECEKLKKKNEDLENEVKKLNDDLNKALKKDGDVKKDNDLKKLKDESVKDEAYTSFDIDDTNTPDEIRRKVQKEMDRREKLAAEERKQAEGALLMEISDLESKHAQEVDKLKKDHEKEKNDLISAHHRAMEDAMAEKERDLMTEFVKDKISSSSSLSPPSQQPVTSSGDGEGVKPLKEELEKKSKEIARLQEELNRKLVDSNDFSTQTDPKEFPAAPEPKDSPSIIPDRIKNFFSPDDDGGDDDGGDGTGKDIGEELRIEKEVKLAPNMSSLESLLRSQIDDLCRQNAELTSEKDRLKEQLDSTTNELKRPQFSPEKLMVDKADVMAERDLLRDQLRRTLNQLNDVTTALTALTNQHRAEKQAWTLAKDQLIDPSKYQQIASRLAWAESANQKLQTILERNQSESANLLVAARESYDKSLKDINKEKEMSDNQAYKLRSLIEDKDQRIKQFNDQQAKTDKLVKDLYSENVRLVKFLQAIEKQKNELNSNNKLLEEKCLALGDLVRKLCPAALE